MDKSVTPSELSLAVIENIFNKTKKEVKNTNLEKETAHTNDSDASPTGNGWYCHRCEEKRMADMRQCGKCGHW